MNRSTFYIMEEMESPFLGTRNGVLIFDMRDIVHATVIQFVRKNLKENYNTSNRSMNISKLEQSSYLSQSNRKGINYLIINQ